MGYVYDFDHEHPRPPMELKELLGGKGANLAEMTSVLGLPVPHGFTISTDACRAYMTEGWPEDLDAEVAEHLANLEQRMGRRLGDPDDPLLVSVRSGAKFSMPGMMDTVLNLGLNDRSVEGLAKQTSDERFAFDSYRRFVQMYGRIVLGIPGDQARRSARSSEGAHRRFGRRAAGGGAAGARRGAEERRRASDRKPLPAGPGGAAPRGDRSRLRIVERGAGGCLPGAGADPERPRDGGQRPGDGVREPGRQVGYGRRFHPRSGYGGEGRLRRLPRERPGRGRSGRHPQHRASRRAEGRVPPDLRAS